MLFTSADEALFAQEVVAATLAGALHAHGSQKAFAQRVGVTPVFISNIIKRRRMPSLRMARRLAPFLPLSTTEQAAWLEHVERYWQARRNARSLVRAAAARDIEVLVQELTACRLSTFTSDPDTVRRQWTRAIYLGEAIQPYLCKHSHALLYLHFADVMFEAYSILGQHVKALDIARRKQAAADLIASDLQAFGLHRSDHKRAEFERSLINAHRFEVVVAGELGLFRHAYQLSLHIEAHPLYQRHVDFFAPLLTWDRLEVMEALPRIGFREAQRIAHRAWEHCERRTDELQPLCHMLLGRAYASFSVSRGKLREAHATLERYARALDDIPCCGALHKTLFLRTQARLSLAQGNWDEWQDAISRATALAQQANLLNELTAIQREVEHAVSKHRPTPPF